jgi:hypothetical protein
MTREEAERLLALAREANLVGPEAAKWVDRLAPERKGLPGGQGGASQP